MIQNSYIRSYSQCDECAGIQLDQAQNDRFNSWSVQILFILKNLHIHDDIIMENGYWQSKLIVFIYDGAY